jgi:hypothetical protein
MIRLQSLLVLPLAMLLPACSYASSYCIATDGGFGPPSFGTTFIEPSFAIPSAGKCESWTGFTKTASTVVLMTSGIACLSSGGKGLTVAVSSQDPSYLGTNPTGGSTDYITFIRSETSEPFKYGEDMGVFGGDAQVVTCTSSLLSLSSTHD